MRRWNKADRLLAFVALLFFALLLVKLRFPDSLAARALFFAAEAALIGGIADWFAVTALFKKPLGFPYHTALLPRNREKFTQACVQMVQSEFFSKKKLLQRVKQVDLVALLLEWLQKSGGREMVAGLLLDAAETALARLDRRAAAALLADACRDAARQASQDAAYRRCGAWLAAGHKDEAAFDALLRVLQRKLERTETKLAIWDYLQDYVDDKSRSLTMVLLNLVAQASNIINYEEAAAALQRQLLLLTHSLLEPEQPLRIELLARLRQAAAELTEDEAWRAMVERWKNEVLPELPLEKETESCLDAMAALLQRDRAQAPTTLPALQTPLAAAILQEIDRAICLIGSDAAIQRTLEQFLYDLAGRSALQAQWMVGVVVREVLSGLSDAAMNRLIYDKVERDLLWIRMNGSIVGAVIGLLLFLALECWRGTV